MKKIYYLFCLVAVMMASACTHEEEDLFDSSSADRADATIKAYTDILTGAENGWLMEYYPEMQQKYGGYNTLVKFEKMVRLAYRVMFMRQPMWLPVSIL